MFATERNVEGLQHSIGVDLPIEDNAVHLVAGAANE